MPPPHLTLSASLSSPSSHGSETIGTPPNDTISFSSNANGKRPASSASMTNDGRNKRPRQDDDEAQSPSTEKGDEPKAKPTRGSRACTVCRRLKMKCVNAENGPPCKRCQQGNHECIFEESNRGKRSTKKHEILTRSLRKMERTLDTVLRSLGNPSLAAGIMSRSPSPSVQSQTMHALLNSPSPSPSLEQQVQHHAPQHASTSHAPPSPKMHSLPDNALNPLGLLAEASLANRRAQAKSNALAEGADDSARVGVASDVYFKPGPMTILPLRRLYIERQIQPEMLSFVSTEEVVALFKMCVQAPFLDPEFHTPSLVCSRSPFLLTSICAVASRFYEAREDLHPKLSELARTLAFQVPARGYKSVEIVQAYLINVLWGSGPVQRYEQDQTWLLLGMAIRMATDLNLHRRSTGPSPDTDAGRARDREMGKPYSIKEDYMIRNASQWARLPGSIPCDGALAAYAPRLALLGTTNSSGLQIDCDFLLVIKTMETQLLAWQHEWLHTRITSSMPPGSSASSPAGLTMDIAPLAPPGLSENVARFRKAMAGFYFHYAMLTINAFGLQNALERSAVDIGHFFARCHSSAVSCATVMAEELGPSGWFRYAPDSHFVMGSYAVLSLLKLIRPEFQAFLNHEQKTIAIVTQVANTFDQIAVSPMHTPALYSCFLRALVSARTDTASVNSTEHTADGTTASSSADPLAPSFAQAPRQVNSLGADLLEAFSYTSEMGPVADMSTFPPTMAPHPQNAEMNMLSMDSILSADFWDSVLVPGSSNTMESLSGGFVYGAGGSGFITPGMWMSPLPSGATSPVRNANAHHDGGDVQMEGQQLTSPIGVGVGA
ncbi:uncharacterized protein BXZ73DRAFT_90131 [Epithele typhae]|uniref:uncharacterized protein n=1 Tax=Epithele typhae TaxID=378194 RepID=UPI002007F9C0|nr:uncharacterized protein BXZ73DRAFT_90131 [Epithele typhae]KAH9931689.1 hypothetical protein BXZ73DRAFT_90131 [Epithele typhae]